MSEPVYCRTCDKLLHKAAKFCPNCRDPEPFGDKEDEEGGFIDLIAKILAAAIIVAFLAWGMTW